MLPSSESFDVEDFGLESNGTIDVCYMVSYVQGAKLLMGVDFVFDGEGIHSDDDDVNNNTDTFEMSVDGYELSGALTIEICVLLGIIIIGFAIGNCCMMCILQCTG